MEVVTEGKTRSGNIGGQKHWLWFISAKFALNKEFLWKDLALMRIQKGERKVDNW